MRTVPTIGCAGKDSHDYSFQYVYPQSNGLATETPSIVIGMCRHCGDIYTVEVPSLTQRVYFHEQKTPFRGLEIPPDSGSHLNFGNGTTSPSDPTPGPSNW